MLFQSEAQRRYLWAKHPKIAQKWADEEKISRRKRKINPDLALGSGQSRFTTYDPLVDKVLSKVAELRVERGLLSNTVKVDGQDYKVNEGYLKPALVGAGAAALVHGLIGIFQHGANRKVLFDSFKSGIPGAIAGLALTEAKRRSIEGILNSDPTSARSLAKKGFDIKPRTTSEFGKIQRDLSTHLPGVVRDSFHVTGIESLAEEGLKVSSLDESKMIANLDDVEDKAHHMHLVYEGSTLAAVLADSSKPEKFKQIMSEVSNPSTVYLVAPASYKEGTKLFTFDEWNKRFPEDVKKYSQKMIDAVKQHGVVLVAPSDVNKAAILRELSRSRDSKLKFIEELPNNRAFKALSKANIIYSLAARSDDRVADASAGAQFAMYIPRVLSDIKATVGANKLSKGTLFKNIAFTSTRAIPGLLPAAGRAFRKYQDKPLSKKE